jgi:putative membrane protein
MYGDHGWFGFGGGFMWVLWILVLVVIIALFRGLSGSGTSASSSESPLEILRRRYARGEISEEEFEHHRKTLEK